MKKLSIVVYGGKWNRQVVQSGGQLWLEKIGEELSKYNDLEVIKIEEPIITKNRALNITHAFLKGFRILLRKPDAIILAGRKDGDMAIAFLHKIISRKTKIYLPIHHYEPITIGSHSLPGRILAKMLRTLVTSSYSILYKDAEAIITVSNTSKEQIKHYLKIPEEKILVTGNGVEIDEKFLNVKTVKDIDFICIGRIVKFLNLYEIWKEIRERNKNLRFEMAGYGKESTMVSKLYELGGFKHHGTVSEYKKMNLLSRSKVFLFPSRIEGYGIAVAEALKFGLPVVAWELPVYKEVWGETPALKLVKKGDYKTFAEEALKTLENYEELSIEARRISSKVKCWKEIAEIIHEKIVRDFKKIY